MIRVLIADDNTVIRQGVRVLLESGCDDIQVVAEASTGREAIDLAREFSPDVVLLDIRMPVMNGVEAAKVLAEDFSVMMLTYSDDEPMVLAAIRAGATGYLVHGRFEPDELERAVRDLASGLRVLSPAVAPVVFDALRRDGAPGQRDENAADASAGPAGSDVLTAREHEVMTMIARGRANREIAAELVISEKTVKNHIRHIYEKLEVVTRAQATAVWLGIASDPGPRP